MVPSEPLRREVCMRGMSCRAVQQQSPSPWPWPPRRRGNKPRELTEMFRHHCLGAVLVVAGSWRDADPHRRSRTNAICTGQPLARARTSSSRAPRASRKINHMTQLQRLLLAFSLVIVGTLAGCGSAPPAVPTGGSSPGAPVAMEAPAPAPVPPDACPAVRGSDARNRQPCRFLPTYRPSTNP